jgi:hypothetical protein
LGFRKENQNALFSDLVVLYLQDEDDVPSFVIPKNEESHYIFC